MSKPRLIIGGGLAAVLLVIVVAVVVWRLRSDDPNLLTEAPAIPTTAAAGVSSDNNDPYASPEAATAAGDSDPTPAPTAVDLPEGVIHFVVDSSGFSAKYVVQETLAGLPSTAVGETSEVTGDLFLTVEGLEASLLSGFQVDLRTLRSDESRRDNYIRGNTLQTSQYPFANFEITGLTDFPADYVEDTEVELTLTGDLTLRDVTLPITWQVKARRAGDTMTAVADTEFKMTDFGINPPQVTLAQAEDGIQLQVVLLLKQQG